MSDGAGAGQPHLVPDGFSAHALPVKRCTWLLLDPALTQPWACMRPPWPAAAAPKIPAASVWLQHSHRADLFHQPRSHHSAGAAGWRNADGCGGAATLTSCMQQDLGGLHFVCSALLLSCLAKSKRNEMQSGQLSCCLLQKACDDRHPSLPAGFQHFDVIHWGGYISALSPFWIVAFNSAWSTAAFVAMLSIGEAIWSPRWCVPAVHGGAWRWVGL